MGLLDPNLFTNPALLTQLKGLLGNMPIAKLMRGEESVTQEGLLGAMRAMPVFDQRAAMGDMQYAADAIGPGAMGVVGAMYKYAPKYRPPTGTNMPAGIAGIDPPSSAHKFGTVSYEKPLNSKQLEQFELEPLDPKHPANIKKAFGEFKDKFMNEFSERGVFEVKRDGKRVGLVTEDASGAAPFRVTLMDGETPTGHEVFGDFDALAQHVWGLHK